MAEFEKVRGQIEGLWNAGLADAEVAGRKAGEAAGVERAVQAVAVLIGEHGGLGPGAFVGELRRRLSAEVPEILEERFTRAEWEASRPAPLGADLGWHAGEVPGPVEGEERMTAAEWRRRHLGEAQQQSWPESWSGAPVPAWPDGVPHQEPGIAPAYSPETLERRRELGIADVDAVTPRGPEGRQPTEQELWQQRHPGQAPYSLPDPIAQAQTEAAAADRESAARKDWEAGLEKERTARAAADAAQVYPPDQSATGRALREADLEREAAEVAADAAKEAHRLADLPPSERSSL